MNIAEATELLRRLIPDLSPDDLARAAQASGGVPLAVKLIADLIRRNPAERVAHLLRGEIYDLDRRGVKLPPKLITEIKPSIVFANEALLEKLKRQPDSIFQLPSRNFEELVAELLDDMGFEVELTKATRDGGKDILDYLNTGIGKFLCLVEAQEIPPGSDRRRGAGSHAVWNYVRLSSEQCHACNDILVLARRTRIPEEARISTLAAGLRQRRAMD